jgi:hypothetical protein
LIKSTNILLLITLVVFTGCNSVNFPVYFENTAREPIEIEVLRPADTTIDQSVKKLLIFTKPGLVPEISILEGKGNFPGKFHLEEVPGIEFYSMADILSASPRFVVMEPIDPVKPAADKAYTRDEIDSICLKAGVDACLFLSRQEVFLGVRNDDNLSSEDGYMPRGYISVFSNYEFYAPGNRVGFSKEVKTGVEFGVSSRNDLEIFETFDEIEKLIKDYASENGEKFAGWIAPVWQKDTRNYFLKGNKELESVKDLIASEKWNEVYSIWRKNIKNESLQTAKHAMYNSVISYEMEGKLDSALMLTNDGYKRFKSEEMIDYGLILQERIRENEVVNAQLGITEKQ